MIDEPNTSEPNVEEERDYYKRRCQELEEKVKTLEQQIEDMRGEWSEMMER